MMRSNLRNISSVFLLLAAIVALPDCGRRAAASRAAASAAKASAAAAAATSKPTIDAIKGHVVVRTGTAISNLNPLTRKDTAQQNVQRIYLAPFLLTENPDDGGVLPAIATALPEVSEDQLALTWTIDPRASWHDGRPVTSADAVATWKMLQELGAAASSTRSELGDVNAVEATSERVFVVRYAAPMATAATTFGTKFPLVAAHTLPDDPKAFATEKRVLGAGPYRVQSITDDGIELERVEPWWGDGIASFANRYRVKRFTLRPTSDRMQDLAQIRERKIDLAALSSLEDFLSLREDQEVRKTYEFSCYYLPSWSFIGWNCADPLFADKRVRQAMSHLVRREEINRNHFGGLGRLVSGPFFHDSPFYAKDVTAARFSIQRAKTLLDEAGWKDTDSDGFLDKDGRKFSFTLLRIAEDVGWVSPILQYLPGDMKQAGIEMEIRPVAYRTLISETLPKHEFQAYLLLWRVEPFDPDLFDLLHSSETAGGNNWQNYSSAAMDEMVASNRTEPDQSKRIERAHAIHRLLAEDQPICFLLSLPTGVVWNRRLKNLVVHPLGIREWDLAADE